MYLKSPQTIFSSFITVTFLFLLSSYSQVPILTIVILLIISLEFLGMDCQLLEGRGHASFSLFYLYSYKMLLVYIKE